MGEDIRRRQARFDALYAAHLRPVLGFAVRRSRQPADAADVVAEVFLVAWRRLDDVPPGDRARLWLYGVARGVLANQRRAAARRSRLGDRLAGALAVEIGADPAESIGTAALARAALARLSDDDREVLELTAWEGLSPAEVAVVLGVPPATARTRLHRARLRLRAVVDAIDGDERPLVGDREDPS